MSKLRLAIVGAGPAGIYAADLLIKSELRDFEVSIDLFDLLPAPYGLVRYGVAPDHPRIKGIMKALFEVLDRGDIRFFGNVEYGKDITLEELQQHYNAVIFATGAIKDADLNIEGINLDGSYGAADFVNWYDAHPDVSRDWPLHAKEIAVIGNGNVALDVARMLVKVPEQLLSTDIPDHVYQALKNSPVTDVHVFGRRGPAQVKFTPLELREATHLEGVDTIVYEEDYRYDAGSEAAIESNNQTRVMVKTLEGLREKPASGAERRLHLHFFSQPTEVLGKDGKVVGFKIERTELDGNGGVTPTGEFRIFDVQAVYRAVGYFGSALPEVAFDAKSGVIPNAGGRVLDEAGNQVPGIYATGWIKRGPIGLIGHTKSDALETIGNLIADKSNWWQPSEPSEDSVTALLDGKAVEYVTWADWLRVDAEEVRLGEAEGRERIKLFDRADFTRVVKMTNLTHLSREGVSLLIDTSAGTPVILHWGRALPIDIDANSLIVASKETTPHCDFDDPQQIGIWRENSRGFLGAPTVIGSHDGLNFSQHFTLRETRQISEFACEFISIDADAELEVSAKFSLLAGGVLEVEQQITNLALIDFKLDSLTTWLALPDYVSERLDFTGRWMNERQPQRQEIQTGTWLREGREGRTGHDFTLIEFAMASGATFEKGEAWGLSLAWSGNTRHLIERTPIGRTSIGAGELLLPGEVILAKDETYTAPRIVAVYSNEGIDGASHRLHTMQRSRANHASNIRPRPVTLNVWEAVYFDHNLAKLTELAKAAGEIGVERFVLDDGWFGSRRDDFSGLGDWTVSPDVWPEGLGPLIDVVKVNGMEFGLWFEGEMVNADSELYRAHPEWILQAGGRVPPTFRNQLVLDLAHEGAFNHVLDQVDAILSEYDIAYIKWDHNRVLTEAANFGRPAVRKQVLAIYRMFDELKTRHPQLEIESCASGGGRIDLEMIEHADRFWTSDNNDALERQNINRYTSIAIAPELLGTHIGPTKAHSTGRTHSHTFRAVTALWGHAGLEWDLTEASEAERELLASFISYYKEKRSLLHTGRVVRTEHAEPSAYVHGVVAQDKSEAIFMLAQLRPSQFSRPANIRITGLDDNSNYFVKVVEPAGAAQFMQLKPPAWFDGVTLSGALLASIGLKSPVLRPEQAMLIEVERV